MWTHGTDERGAQGILAGGRVLATAKPTLHLTPGQVRGSFLCRVNTAPDSTQGFQDQADACTDAPNSCGVVFSSFFIVDLQAGQSSRVKYDSGEQSVQNTPICTFSLKDGRNMACGPC